MESALSLLIWWCVLFLFPKEPWLLSWRVDLVDYAILSNFLYWYVLSLTVLTFWVAILVLYNGPFPIAFSLFVKETPVAGHFIAEAHFMVVTWPYVHPPARPMWNVTLSSYFGSLQLDIANPCCGQLTAVKTKYLLTSITWPYRGLRCRPIEVFFLSLPLTSFQFSTDRRLNCNWISLLKKFFH